MVKMPLEDALTRLGLEPDCSQTDVYRAHHSAMRALRVVQPGTPEEAVARELNVARDTVLAEIKAGAGTDLVPAPRHDVVPLPEAAVLDEAVAQRRAEATRGAVD